MSIYSSAEKTKHNDIDIDHMDGDDEFEIPDEGLSDKKAPTKRDMANEEVELQNLLAEGLGFDAKDAEKMVQKKINDQETQLKKDKIELNKIVAQEKDQWGVEKIHQLPKNSQENIISFAKSLNLPIPKGIDENLVNPEQKSLSLM